MLGFQSHDQGSTASLSLYPISHTHYALPVSDFLFPPEQQSSLHRSKSSALPRLRTPPRWTLAIQKAANAFQPSDASTRTSDMATFTALPSDLSRLVDIEFAAFKHEKTNHHLSYRDPSDPAHVRRALRCYRKYMNNPRLVSTELIPLGRRSSDGKLDFNQQRESSTLGFRFRKVILPGSNEVVAFCKSEMTALTLDDLLAPLDIGHEGEPPMNTDWFALNERLHREYCGVKKHCYFGMLATHPDHQNRGAASLLMDELTSEADQAGVEIYCEATKTGRPLYEKYGFVAVKEITFDTRDYGADLGVERQTVMVRPALGKDGKRRKARSWDEAVAESLTDMANMSAIVDRR